MLKRRMTKLLDNLTCFFSYDPFGWMLASLYSVFFMFGFSFGMSMFDKFRGITSYNDFATWEKIINGIWEWLSFIIPALILIALILYLAGLALYPKYADNPYRKTRVLSDVALPSVGLGALPFFGLCVLSANLEQIRGFIPPWELKQYIVLIVLPAVLFIACVGQTVLLARKSMQTYKQYRQDEWRFELKKVGKETEK